MYQKFIGIGRLTKAPDLRYTATNNLPVCSFTLAVNRPYGDKEADFLNCIVWRKQAENVNKYVSKGSMVAVEGRIQTRDYMDEKNNIKRYVTEIVCDSVTFLDTKKMDQEQNQELPKEKKQLTKEEIDDLPFD